MKPVGASHVESDGTFWKHEKGIWMFWNARWGWSHFVGKADERFLNKLTMVA